MLQPAHNRATGCPSGLCAAGVLALAALLGVAILGFSLRNNSAGGPARKWEKSQVSPTDHSLVDRMLQPVPDSHWVPSNSRGEAPALLSPLFVELGRALNALKEEPDQEAKEQRFTAILEQVPAGEIPAILEFLSHQQPHELIQETAIGLLRTLAQTDPLAAANAALEMKAANRQEAINLVIPLWAQHDLEAAQAWVEALPEGELKTATEVTLAYEMAAVNPAVALKLAMGLSESQASDQVLAHAAMQWAGKAPREAADWASKLEEKALRERVLATIATTWGNTDPVTAGQLVIDSIPAGRAQTDALVGIVQRWVQTDPTAAAAWVAKFPQGKLRTAAMENVANQWGQADYSKAGDWLNTLPRDASWDAAVGVYASVLAPTDRNRALSWAASIQDAALRTSIMKQVENR